jgi:translocation and assembly module TamB
MTRLADLAPLIGQPVSGALSAAFDASARGASTLVKMAVIGNDIAVGTNRVAKMSLAGQVTDPLHPDVSLALSATGLAAGNITGDAHAAVHGPQSALAVQAGAQLHNVAGGDARFATRLAVDATRRTAVLSSLDADAHGESLRLAAPARIEFGSTVAVDRLRLALGQASLDIAGTIAPALSLTADVRNVTPDLAKPFAPGLDAAGVLTASARLTGSTAKPQGSIRVSAQGLRLRTGPAASIPAAGGLVTVLLQGERASVNAHVSAGPKLDASVTGGVPLGAGALSLQARAKIDLTALDPILGATGQRTEGLLTLNGSVTGTTAKPTLGGRLTLAGGEVQDFVQGVLVQNIAADIEADGDRVRIASFTGHAGDGSIAASGTIGLAEPGIPIDLHITADHAKPISSDRLTTTLDADIGVSGEVAKTMLVAGRVFLRRTDINIPNAFPPSVAKLNVIRPGQKPPPPSSAPASVVRLALSIDAPQSIFVRGHGLDAELGGKLAIGGTTAGPDIAGGFELRRGDFSLAGTTLQFSKGEVSFNGSGVGHAIDPTLDFEADSTNGGITATLAITGYADAPKIALSSVPALPQDEVLAHLLFGTSVSSLSPIQIAEIASAVAELSGVGGGGNPLGSVRNSLGLDRLDVSGGTGSTGATVQAGRYVARGVYVGAKQATGGGTVAQVQVDLTKHLKATGQVGTGGGSVQGATPENDTGSTIGLSYRFEY